jgi:phospho-N-acetylmuramoyl-pentapeptide-transferase
MLYLLLYPLHKYYSALNALRYETLRSVLAGLAAFALSLALGPVLIERFRAMHIGQTIRDVVPQGHQKKAGTPTMGGLLILASMLSATLLLANVQNPFVWIAIFVTVTFGAIGFSDDYFKLSRGKGLGLSGPAKLILSFSCAFLATAYLFLYLRFDTHLTVPFLKNIHPDLHWWFYIPFALARGEPN